MNIISTIQMQTTDCKLCMATLAAIYSPLLLILIAALVAF